MTNRAQRILIIEDDPDAQLRLVQVLQDSGFDVSCAADAVTCLSTAQQTHPDLILLDLGLPGGSGLDVIRRLRGNMKLIQTPIVVFTADDTPASRDASLAAGASDFVGKSASRAELLAAIDGVISH